MARDRWRLAVRALALAEGLTAAAGAAARLGDPEDAALKGVFTRAGMSELKRA